MRLGAAKTARELAKSPDDPETICRALFYAQRLKLIERQRTGQALPEPRDGTEGAISREKASDYNSVGLKNRRGWPQNEAMRPNPS
jgi:hypothetical protein